MYALLMVPHILRQAGEVVGMEAARLWHELVQGQQHCLHCRREGPWHRPQGRWLPHPAAFWVLQYHRLASLPAPHPV